MGYRVYGLGYSCGVVGLNEIAKEGRSKVLFKTTCKIFPRNYLGCKEKKRCTTQILGFRQASCNDYGGICEDHMCTVRPGRSMPFLEGVERTDAQCTTIYMGTEVYLKA